MKRAQCEHLDGYIGEWLGASGRQAFEAHLGECSACQGELGRQARLDELLSSARDQLEPVPVSLVRGIEGRLRSAESRRGRYRLGAGLAAAAVLVLAVTRPLGERWSSREGEVAEVIRRAPLSAGERARAAFKGRQKALGELAVLITSRSRSVETSAHPWVRVARIDPPMGFGVNRRRSKRRPTIQSGSSPKASGAEELKITRGLPPFNARNVLSRRTLGERSWRAGVFPPSRAMDNFLRNGDDL